MKRRIQVTGSALRGTLVAPASKSHSLRAILFAALAEGTSTLHNCLLSTDKQAMVAAWRQCGALIEDSGSSLIVQGVAGHCVAPTEPVDAGNSGIVLRFMAALAATQSKPMVITGDQSVCSNRPVKPLIDALPQLGAVCRSVRGNQHAPIEVYGPIGSGCIIIDGADSQPVSGLMIAASQTEGTQEIIVNSPGELPWLDLTLWWLDRLGIPYERKGYERFVFKGRTVIAPLNFCVPGDFSSIAFVVAAAMLTESTVTVTGLDWTDPQGDKALLNVFEQMGAVLVRDRVAGSLTVTPQVQLVGVEVDINAFVDGITVLAVVACFASTPTLIKGAAIARKKECDRIAAIAAELTKMGAIIEERDDGLLIYPSVLHAAEVGSHHDHRMAMSLAVAAMTCEGVTVINDATCIAKTYAHFVEAMQSLGANTEWVV